MTDKQRDSIRWACRKLAIRNALHREWYLDSSERLTHPVAQFQVGMLLTRIRAEWRREQKELGL